METEQKLTPKYWIVRKVGEQEVFINSADKNKEASILKFMEKHGYQYFGMLQDADLVAEFVENENFECVLFSIEQVIL